MRMAGVPWETRHNRSEYTATTFLERRLQVLSLLTPESGRELPKPWSEAVNEQFYKEYQPVC